ncbi:MAG: DUF202 domain-containing protein [Chloroflexi bacterium]|nr:DUF202 domain-containing protein [Chloroflexota bacterium]
MNTQPLDQKTKDKTTDFLANERTFLAWIRTGIATISLGFVIARFSFWLRELAFSTGNQVSVPQTGLSLPMGLGMVAFGALVVLLAALRYQAVHHAIENDLPHPRPTLLFITTGAVILLAMFLIGYLLIASSRF